MNQATNKDAEGGILSATIAIELRDAILAGALAPGTRIRQEELAERFGTSRIPVREALKDLESQGLVTLVPNSGAWISLIDVNECNEIYKIRERIEPLALGESIMRMPQARIDQLELLVSAIEKARDVEEFLRLDRQFHLESYADSGMARLLSMIERFWNTTQQYRRAYTKLIGDQGQWVIHYEHRLLLEAIRRRDSEEGEHMLRAHIRRTRLQFEERTGQTARQLGEEN